MNIAIQVTKYACWFVTISLLIQYFLIIKVLFAFYVLWYCMTTPIETYR